MHYWSSYNAHKNVGNAAVLSTDGQGHKWRRFLLDSTAINDIPFLGPCDRIFRGIILDVDEISGVDSRLCLCCIGWLLIRKSFCCAFVYPSILCKLVNGCKQNVAIKLTLDENHLRDASHRIFFCRTDCTATHTSVNDQSKVDLYVASFREGICREDV